MTTTNRNITIRNAAYRLIKERGPLTAIEIFDGVRNHRGKRYRDMPSPNIISQILIKDSRFAKFGTTTMKYANKSTKQILVWGLNDEK